MTERNEFDVICLRMLTGAVWAAAQYLAESSADADDAILAEEATALARKLQAKLAAVAPPHTLSDSMDA